METVNSNLFQSHCTWKATEGKTINEAIAWSDRNENSDIEETIQAENCILLESPIESSEAGQPPSECRLMLYSQPPYLIQKVTVLCEARLIEVYGRHAEYLKSIRNQIVDEVDDMVVFRGDVQLDRPSPECSLKFTGLKVKASMWLYGVTVKVSPTTSNIPPVSTLLSPTNNMPSSMDRNRNNAQFMSLMTSMFGPPNEPRPQPVIAPATPQPDMMGVLMSLMQANQSPIAAAGSQQTVPGLTSPMQQQSVMQLINQIAQQQIAQHYPVPNVPLQNGPIAQSSPNSQSLVNGSVINSQILPQNNTPATNGIENILRVDDTGKADNQEVFTQPRQPEKIETPLPESTQEELIEEKVAEVATAVANPPAELTINQPATSTNLQQVGLSKSVGATPSQETAFELPAEVIDQITDSVVNNIECGLENMEQRLWGKIVHRLQEMENRIMGRMEEVIEVLREVEEECDERETLEQEDERDLEDEEDEEEESDSVLKV